VGLGGGVLWGRKGSEILLRFVLKRGIHWHLKGLMQIPCLSKGNGENIAKERDFGTRHVYMNCALCSELRRAGFQSETFEHAKTNIH
jgi:hypothetical protein